MTKGNGQIADTFSTLDAHISGYLSLRGYKADLIDQTGKIVFVFRNSDSLQQALTDFHSGFKVEACLLVAATKALKGRVHDMRRDKGNSYGTARPRP